jgi:hypothetical protein
MRTCRLCRDAASLYRRDVDQSWVGLEGVLLHYSGFYGDNKHLFFQTSTMISSIVVGSAQLEMNRGALCPLSVLLLRSFSKWRVEYRV